MLVIQNNLGNHFSPTIIIAAITAKMAKPKLPTHIGIKSNGTGIERDSVILLEQIRTIDKSRLKEKVCHLDRCLMERLTQLCVLVSALKRWLRSQRILHKINFLLVSQDAVCCYFLSV